MSITGKDKKSDHFFTGFSVYTGLREGILGITPFLYLPVVLRPCPVVLGARDRCQSVVSNLEGMVIMVFLVEQFGT